MHIQLFRLMCVWVYTYYVVLLNYVVIVEFKT